MVKSTKDVAAKFNLPESSLHGRKMKKNLKTFEIFKFSSRRR